MNKKFFINCFSLAVLGSILMISDVSARTKDCSVRTLKGPYAISFQGTAVIPVDATHSSSVPVALIGLSNYDGRGGFSSKIQWNQGGVSQNLDVTGSYTMDGDCTGEAVFNIPKEVLNLPDESTLTISAVAGDRVSNSIYDFVFISTKFENPGVPGLGLVGTGTGKQQ